MRLPARTLRALGLATLSAAIATGCSLRQLAVDSIGDALAGGGSVYERDDDVALVGEALPFGLKLLDSLVLESPRNRGLLVSASRGYLLYAYGYIAPDAERLAAQDVDRANAVRARVRGLALRACGYATRAIELAYPGFGAALARDPPRGAAAIADPAELDALYAATASLAVAIGAGRQDAAMLARLAEVDALLARALALDEAWRAGSLHELAMQWLGSRPGVVDRGAIEAHYARALALSGGNRATLFVAYAETVSVRAQDRRGFEHQLARALAVDLDARPDERLQNALAQRRARWLLSQADNLFLE